MVGASPWIPSSWRSSTWTVRIGHVQIEVSPLERRLLACLAARAGMVVPSEVLIERVWEPGYPAHPKALNVYIRRVRRRIEAHGPRIETVRSLGYRLEVPARSVAVAG